MVLHHLVPVLQPVVGSKRHANGVVEHAGKQTHRPLTQEEAVNDKRENLTCNTPFRNENIYKQTHSQRQYLPLSPSSLQRPHY